MTAFLFFISFACAVYGLSGTVPAYRDSGDLIASIHTLGIAHPPGYAFYVLLGKLFVTLLPFGNIAYRVNVMSAFFAAAASAALYRLLLRESGSDRIGSMAVAFLFGFSPAVIALGRAAEMYTLSAFLAVLIVYFLFSDHPNGVSWAALLLGLGLSVHPTLIFLAPLFFGRVLLNKGTSEEESKCRMFGLLLPCSLAPLLYFLLGLSVFLYLPFRAAQHPLLNWGDPSHWRNFWRVVTRADYGGLKLHPEESVLQWTPVSVASELKYFLVALKGEWGWLAVFLGIAGIMGSLRDPGKRSWACGLLASWMLAGPGFFILSNLPLGESTTPAILQPYLLVVGVLWAPFVVQGFEMMRTLVIRSRTVAVMAALLLVTARPWGWTSERNDFYAYDYACNLLRSLPRGAVLYDPDDTTLFCIRVLQTVENRRPDLVLLSFFRTRWGYEEIRRRWPDLLPPIPIDNGQDLQRLLWSYSARKFPFYTELPQKFGQVPYESQGLVYAALLTPSPDGGRASRARAEELLEMTVKRGDFVTTDHPDFFTRHIVSYYAAAENNLGADYANAGHWAAAARHYRAALQIEPDQSAAHFNLGVALSRLPQ